MNNKIIEIREYLEDKENYIILDINSDNIFNNIEIDNIYLCDIEIT